MLPVLEIENVLMDFAIIEAIMELIHASNEDIERFKQYFFNTIDGNKNSQKVQSIIDVAKIDALYTERLTKLETDLADNNYEELVKRVDLNII